MNKYLIIGTEEGQLILRDINNIEDLLYDTCSHTPKINIYWWDCERDEEDKEILYLKLRRCKVCSNKQFNFYRTGSNDDFEIIILDLETQNTYHGENIILKRKKDE